MKQDMKDLTLKPFDFSQILDEVPEIRKFAFKIDTYSFEPPIDSSDVEPSSLPAHLSSGAESLINQDLSLWLSPCVLEWHH